ncbi:class D sortase [Sporosarcina aquimarina]|uniref:Class D sortase n=1 Tax=Sporosarcina aquimarina TaxID=114975 RepID=A0ABU4FVH1_9BACL|nr:class D sortase [Sporosarcina aquimarina]MDW0108706.1 class D sortase [Sporosarcina aquimarina]
MRIRKLFGALLLMVGIGILFLPFMEKRAYEKSQDEILKAFEKLGSFDASAQTLELPSSEEHKNGDDSSVELLDGVRGLLQIDKIDLEMAIFDGVSANALQKGIGMIEPNKQFDANNIGLAGHRAVAHGKQFNRLDELKLGDEMSVVTQEGTFHYVITDSYVVHQSEVSVLDEGDNPRLTLVTCTPVGSLHPPNRLIVQGELKDK